MFVRGPGGALSWSNGVPIVLLRFGCFTTGLIGFFRRFSMTFGGVGETEKGTLTTFGGGGVIALDLSTSVGTDD